MPPARRRSRVLDRGHEPGPRIDVPSGPLGAQAVGELCADASAALERSRGTLICDANQAVFPDLSTVEAVARLALTARRRGHKVRIERPPRRLVDLLDLCGLAGLLAHDEARDARRRRRG